MYCFCSLTYIPASPCDFLFTHSLKICQVFLNQSRDKQHPRNRSKYPKICPIWYHLHNLNVEECLLYKLLMAIIKNYTNGTKSRKVSHIMHSKKSVSH